MGAYLVSAAGDEADAAEGEGASRPQHIHIGDDLLAALVLGLVGVDAHLVVLLVVLPPRGEPSALGDAHRDGVILFFEQVSADDLVHVPEGGVALGRDDEALSAAVEAVADAGLEAVLALRVVLALLGQILGEGVHKVCVAGAVAVAEQVGGLVEDGNVLILVDDRHLGLVLLLFEGGLPGGLCTLRREEFVVDVEFDEVAGLDAVFGYTLFAVDFDAFVAEALV